MNIEQFAGSFERIARSLERIAGSLERILPVLEKLERHGAGFGPSRSIETRNGATHNEAETRNGATRKEGERRAYRIPELATTYNFCPEFVRSQIKKGHLRGHKVGGVLLILAEDAEEWLRSNPATADGKETE